MLIMASEAVVKSAPERINKLLPENTFEFIVTSSDFMFRKPNKRIFDLALEKAELQPDEVWYIGDQYECGVQGSLNAGLQPVWYIGGYFQCLVI